MPKLESEWLKLWCPKARPVTVVQISGVSVSVASGNRDPDGEIKDCAKCVGSACAAWAWETERPEDGYEYFSYALASKTEEESFVAEKAPMAAQGWEFIEIPSKAPGSHWAFARWRKPWLPFGFCCAFPNPNRFPSAE